MPLGHRFPRPDVCLARRARVVCPGDGIQRCGSEHGQWPTYRRGADLGSRPPSHHGCPWPLPLAAARGRIRRTRPGAGLRRHGAQVSTARGECACYARFRDGAASSALGGERGDRRQDAAAFSGAPYRIRSESLGRGLRALGGDHRAPERSGVDARWLSGGHGDGRIPQRGGATGGAPLLAARGTACPSGCRTQLRGHPPRPSRSGRRRVYHRALSGLGPDSVRDHQPGR